MHVPEVVTVRLMLVPEVATGRVKTVPRHSY